MEKYPMTVADRILLEKALRVKSITNDEHEFVESIAIKFYNDEYLTKITNKQRKILKEIAYIHEQAIDWRKF